MVPDHLIIDGENVMMWPSKDGPKFAQDLMSKYLQKKNWLDISVFRPKQGHLPEYCYLETT